MELGKQNCIFRSPFQHLSATLQNFLKIYSRPDSNQSKLQKAEAKLGISESNVRDRIQILYREGEAFYKNVTFNFNLP